jgi:hypothetical protein
VIDASVRRLGEDAAVVFVAVAAAGFVAVVVVVVVVVAALAVSAAASVVKVPDVLAALARTLSSRILVSSLQCCLRLLSRLRCVAFTRTLSLALSTSLCLSSPCYDRLLCCVHQLLNGGSVPSISATSDICATSAICTTSDICATAAICATSDICATPLLCLVFFLPLRVPCRTGYSCRTLVSPLRGCLHLLSR